MSTCSAHPHAIPRHTRLTREQAACDSNANTTETQALIRAIYAAVTCRVCGGSRVPAMRTNDDYAVVLTCGHHVCVACDRSHRYTSCPVCRSWITSRTTSQALTDVRFLLE
jgi:hypothetical protein